MVMRIGSYACEVIGCASPVMAFRGTDGSGSTARIYAAAARPDFLAEVERIRILAEAVEWLPKVIDSGVEGDIAWIAVEDVGPAPVVVALPTIKDLDLALKLTKSVGAALYQAHEFGMVHGRVGPDTVLVHRDGVSLAEFGLHKLFLTSSLRMQGYAPEVVSDGEIDARADVFGLALLTVACLAGNAHTTEVPADVEPRIADVLRRALAADPAWRPATIPEFLTALQGAQDALGREKDAEDTDPETDRRLAGAPAPVPPRPPAPDSAPDTLPCWTPSPDAMRVPVVPPAPAPTRWRRRALAGAAALVLVLGAGHALLLAPAAPPAMLATLSVPVISVLLPPPAPEAPQEPAPTVTASPQPTPPPRSTPPAMAHSPKPPVLSSPEKKSPPQPPVATPENCRKGRYVCAASW